MRCFVASVATLLFLVAAVCLGGDAPKPVLIPRLVDPPPIIDADLMDWEQYSRGAALDFTDQAQVTYNPGKWRGVDDLSGQVRLGHDGQYLYVCAKVRDDKHAQPFSGADLWKGDHIALLLDFVRDGDPTNLRQIGVSPGALGEGAARPEVFLWQPARKSLTTAVVASRRVDGGYVVEAAIPWQALDVTPAAFQRLNLDVALMEMDSDPPASSDQVVMSWSRANWSARNPKRLIPAGLAKRTGEYPMDRFQDNVTLLAKDVYLPAKAQKEFTFDAAKAPDGMIPILKFKARAVWPEIGGCIPGMRIEVNGKPLSKKYFPDRPTHMEFVCGTSSPSSWGDNMTLFYAPDFDSLETSRFKPIGFKGCYYMANLSEVVQPGKNTIVFMNKNHIALKAKPVDMALGDIEFFLGAPSLFKPPKQWKPAPTGELSLFEPDTRHKVSYKASQPDPLTLRLEWKGRALTVKSEFRSAAPLKHTRRIEECDAVIVVHDTLENPTDGEAPVLLRHTAPLDEYEALNLCGRNIPNKTGANSIPPNPSVTILYKDSGFALLANDDVFRVHSAVSCDGKTASLADTQLVLRPGVRYEHQWILAPLDRPDYYAFVNAMRRHYKTNFTIPGSFAYFFTSKNNDGLAKELMDLTPERATQWLDWKSAYYVCVLGRSQYKESFAQGVSKMWTDPANRAADADLVRRIRPGSPILSYYNCFDFSQAKGDPLRWPAALVRRPDGQPIRGDAVHQVFTPGIDPAYDKACEETVDWILKETHSDGLFWDMYNGYGFHCLENVNAGIAEGWDGWSGLIDGKTLALKGKKSSTFLLSWPFREKIMKRMAAEGRPVVINGAPWTVSEYQFKIAREVESADVGRVSQSHFFTPIALGDHTTEKSEADAYQHMLNALRWGGLYYWYSTTVTPNYHTLTRFMFPFT